MIALAAFVAAGTSALVTSCSLLVDTSGLSGGAQDDSAVDGASGDGAPADTAMADRAATDAPETPDAAVDAAEAGPRRNSCGGLLFGTPVPLTNPDFELGCSNSWGGYEATITEETSLVSSGSVACRLCFVAGPDGFFINRTTSMPVLQGETYELVACVRDVPDAAATTPYAFMIDPPGQVGVQGTAVAPGPTYVPVRAAWTVGQPYTGLQIGIRAPTVDGGCFIVDDVTLSKVP